MRFLMLPVLPALIPGACFAQGTWHVDHCVFPAPGLPAAACFAGEHMYGTTTPVSGPSGSWLITSQFSEFHCDFTGINLLYRSEIVLRADSAHIGWVEVRNAAGAQIGTVSRPACGEVQAEFLTSELPPGLPPTVVVEWYSPCYHDCNCDGYHTIADFSCFQGAWVLGNLYADCNGTGTLTIVDFGCFQASFGLCP